MSKNYYKNNSGRRGGKGVLTVILAMIFSVAASLGAVVAWERFKPAAPNNDENNTLTSTEIGGMIVPESAEGNGISLFSAAVAAEDYTDYGISAHAESAVTITATVLPEGIARNQVDWSIAWADPSITADLTQVTVTPESDGALSATVACSAPFRYQMSVTVTCRANPDVSASVPVDYVAKFYEPNIPENMNLALVKGNSVESAVIFGYDVQLGDNKTYFLRNNYNGSSPSANGLQFTAYQGSVPSDVACSVEFRTSSQNSESPLYALRACQFKTDQIFDNSWTIDLPDVQISGTGDGKTYSSRTFIPFTIEAFTCDENFINNFLLSDWNTTKAGEYAYNGQTELSVRETILQTLNDPIHTSKNGIVSNVFGLRFHISVSYQGKEYQHISWDSDLGVNQSWGFDFTQLMKPSDISTDNSGGILF